MSTTTINTLCHARRLEAAGVPEHQAEEMADALGNELAGQLAPRTTSIQQWPTSRTPSRS